LTRRPLILLGLLAFIGAGTFAFFRLNIEAYPNPAPVILEITAQAPGLSAEEMERYYTIPIEVGLAATPGVDVIRSTSFYGLSFVRVVFQYGVDYYFALTQTAINLQQNVSLPSGVTAQIQGTSLVGEIYRYELVGPPHFGLSNLRTVQDWILQRRLLSVPGVVQVNTWGGTTKEYDVDVDLQKLEAYGLTLPQVISAIGNANTNVGGRTINVGQQSVNVRGVGLMDSGGETDLTQGYKVKDIENVMLSAPNGLPIFVKDIAKVSVGYAPRLGKAGRDHSDDVVAAIVIMNRTLHTNDVITRVRAEIQKINTDGSLPPGLKLIPFYDRSTLVAVTTSTVMHNLLFGCLLIFFVQWLFLGDLRSAIIVGANVPFALFFSIIILVLRGEDANLLSVGAVDFGIIGRLGPGERRFLAEILWGFLRRDYARVAEVHFEAGYVPAGQDRAAFAQALRAVGEPVFGRPAAAFSMSRLLTQLFEVTALFDMHLRPELVLLQKTMVTVEAVARRIDPRHDIWASAEPVVRRWITRELSPASRMRDLVSDLRAAAVGLAHLAAREAERPSDQAALVVSTDDPRRIGSAWMALACGALIVVLAFAVATLAR